VILFLIFSKEAMAANFRSVHGIFVDKKANVFIVDMAANQIKKINQEGLMSIYAGTGKLGSKDGSLTEAEFNSPAGIVGDQIGNIYVADQRNHKIRKISVDGVVSTLAGNGLSGYKDGVADEAMFSYPENLEIAADGSILVTDKLNNLVRVVKDGQVSTLK
jgi:DNA-binding beta-propeller fold protein YncE